MPEPAKCLLTAICVLTSFAAHAQDAMPEAEVSGVQQALEMPAHRLLIGVIQAPDARLEPFTTDGCSGGMSGGWRYLAAISQDFADAYSDQPPWQECCVIHDLKYHDAGGADDAVSSFLARLAADEELRACVVATGQPSLDQLAERYSTSPERVETAYALIASSMFNAVRLGGGPCSGLSWRWGYGYPGCFWSNSDK